MKKYDILAEWRINEFCNFSCKYCSVPLKHNHKYLGPSNIDKIIDFFDKTDFKFLIHMSGGEPFLCPDFIKLCESLTKRHRISINTNLATGLINELAKRIDPKKVEFIHSSLHISERERLNLKEDFIKKYKTLEQAGFNVFASQIMHPENLKEFDKIFNHFKSKGVIIFPKVFKGAYKGKRYPWAYTQEEKEKIGAFRKMSKLQEMKETLKFLALDKESNDGGFSFKGLPCSAGRKFIAIEFDGALRRCLDDNTYLGDIFKGRLKLFNKDKLCIAKTCSCPYFGLTFACGHPRLLTNPPSKNFLERFVYPFTTPILKPVRKIAREFFTTFTKNDKS